MLPVELINDGPISQPHDANSSISNSDLDQRQCFFLEEEIIDIDNKIKEEKKVYQSELEEPSFISDRKSVEVDLNMSEDRSFLTMR